MARIGRRQPVTPWISRRALPALVVVTGTMVSGSPTEVEVVAGTETTILTLTGDQWLASGADFNGTRQSLIDACDSAQSEGAGWNAEVRDKEVVGAVVRTSATVVTITWSAAAAYDITATETITVTVPSSALLAGVLDVTASPTFGVTAVGASLPALETSMHAGGFGVLAGGF